MNKNKTKISENIKSLKVTVRKAVAPTIVATLIFFMTYFFFGTENTMIGPFATLSFLRYRTMHNHYECMIKNFAIYIAMAVLSYFAVMNLPLCIIINALALFWIADLLIDEYNPANYFPAGMALIFFQIAPVSTPAALANRIAALLATFVLVFLFVFILSRMNPNKDPLPGYLKQGFENCRSQISLCRLFHSTGEDCSSDTFNEQSLSDLDALHHNLCEINKKCSGEIYSYNRATLRQKGRTNWYCHFILVFQIINYLTLNHQQTDNLTKAEVLYHDYRNEFESVTPSLNYRRLNFRIRCPDIRSFRLRFALRQLITVTPCLIFAWASHLPNVYWLVISVFFMMIPFTDHTMQRVRQRVLGTIAGILICLGLFYIFPGFPARVIIMTAANFLIYGANGYGPTVAYITCSALALQTMNASVLAVLLQRLLYTLIGAVIALAANKWIFPIRIKKQISYLMEMIRSICSELTDLNRKTIPGDGRRRKEIDQRIVKSYLLTKRLESLYETLPPSGQTIDYKQFEKEHMTFMAEYLSRYLIREKQT